MMQVISFVVLICFYMKRLSIRLVLFVYIILSIPNVIIYANDEFQSVVKLSDEVWQYALNNYEYALGSKKDAKIVMVVATSYSCPHCRLLHIDILPKIVDKYVSTGDLAILYYNILLYGGDIKASMLTSCIANHSQDKQNKLREVLYDKQGMWVYSDSDRRLWGLAHLAGMNYEEYEKCINDKELENFILSTKKDIVKYMIYPVRKKVYAPYIIISGKSYKGILNYHEIESIIQRELSNIR